jgi:hypothetical protein
MKKLILLIIMGFLAIYGFSINPIDPPAKPADVVKATVPKSSVTTEEFTELFSLVDVTVIVTFTDCPDYICEYPRNCSFKICIYDNNYNLLACQDFDFGKCQYTFEGIRANEYTTLYSHVEAVTPPGCSSSYNNGFDPSTNQVPSGGGTVYISTQYCP